MRFRAPLLLALVSLASPAIAGIRYVNAALTTGANDGSTWANAYQGTLGMKAAFQNAVAGDQVWAAQGVYKPGLIGSPSLSFVLQSGVQYYGGFTGSETQLDQRDPAAHPTILSGDLADDDDTHSYNDNSMHVVDGGTSDASALLDGFTVQGGSAVGGGGITCTGGCMPGIRNCVFRRNRAINGAAVFVDSASPRFHFTRFEENHATTLGGAFHAQMSSLLSFTGCSFVANTAGAGGAGSSVGVLALNLRNCVFRENQVDGSGSSLGGGALLLLGSAVAIDGCTVAGNEALVGDCGGVRNFSGSTALTNSIVYFNHGQPGGTLLGDNVMGLTASWSCIQGGLFGPGNLSVDPLFVDQAAGDLHLALTSPCADAGKNALVPSSAYLDADGMPRFADDALAPDTGVGTAPIVDMGAFETRTPLAVPFCAGDGTLATACPCGNPGMVGRGCRNSDLFSVGALLTASGSIVPDTVVLEASDMLASVTCVFLQGSQPNANGVLFGDGVRCVAGSLKRLFIKTASGGAASAPGAGDPTLSSRSAALGDAIAPGSQRFYQVYYRDPDPFFCPSPAGSTWNVTSGVIVFW